MTPIRDGLNGKSSLLPRVADGLGAVHAAHKKLVDEALRGEFADSLDIDEGLRVGNEQAHRWDYLLGHTRGKIVGLEPHSAHTSEVSVVKAKRNAALAQLRTHLKPKAQVARWFWVASGKIAIVPFTKTRTQLAEAGVTFVGKVLTKRHLEGL